jgi:hypothetical protein
MVDKNVTNSKSTVTQEEIENLPVRGVEGIVALQAGIVSQGGQIYVRGSRGDGTGYIVDGVNANDPIYGGRALNVINNAIAEVNFQAGGYSAEFGGANGGLVMTTTRSGGRQYQIGFEAYTDSWSEPGEENFLGSYNYGNSLYALTAGGPLFGPVRFFVAGQNLRAHPRRSIAARIHSPINMTLRCATRRRMHCSTRRSRRRSVSSIRDSVPPRARWIIPIPGGYVVNTADEYYVLLGQCHRRSESDQHPCGRKLWYLQRP